MQRYVMTLRCPDQPGIIRAFAEGVVNASGNIVDNKQFSDPDSGTFCMRTEVDSPLGSAEEVEQHLLAALAGFSPSLTVRPESAHRKMLVMVSKFDHCLVDLLYRHETGELPVEIPLVVSNHEDLRGLVEHHGIPFVHLPVTKETKADAEAALLDLVEKHEIDFVVLARYMQVLSDDLCRALEGRVINIHHSFLPGFKGAKPYHQAYARGVMLCGATPHPVTAALPSGPIIQLSDPGVTHAASPEALVALGRDTERLALSRAVRQHAEDRVLLIGSRTVVFSA